MFAGEDQETLNNYLSSLPKYARLSIEEQKTANTNELITAYLHLVVRVAKWYPCKNMQDFLDVIQDGNVGLVMAAHRYKRKNHDFSFAPEAELGIKKYILQRRSFRPRNVIIPPEIAIKEKKIQTMFDEGNSIEDIANEISISPDRVLTLLTQDYEPGDNDIKDETQNLEYLADKERIKHRAKSVLTDRQYYVLAARVYGESWDYIASTIDLTGDHTRHLWADIVKALK